ncbi:MAG: hypothetical protein HKP61_20270 [Dactylosporangium sp.]|nr:hypothetical protein [Dactylosporangium sp.]NNJ63220.1 hypothetical protein [Dactylosporangium sp.]
MPRRSAQPADTGLPPVPIAILLPPPVAGYPRPDGIASDPAPLDEYGLTPRTLARLIATYTRHDDLVIDLDHDDAVASAVAWLGRRTGVPFPEDTRRALDSVREGQRAGLLIVRLPRSGIDPSDPPSLASVMLGWRAALRPGGSLLMALTTACARDHSTTVIAAARVAGLRYHQHLIAAYRPLVEDEPRAEALTAASTRPALVDGRHDPAHASFLSFIADGDSDA